MVTKSKLKQPIVYGPWPGGMNAKDDGLFVQDSELVDIVNFDVSDVGLLTPRRYLTYVDLDATIVGSVLSANVNDITCILKATSGVQFYKTSNGETFSTTTFTGLTATGNYYEVLKYDGYTYYCNLTGTSSFRVLGDTNTGAVTLLPNWPNSSIANSPGGKAFLFKDRAWVVNGNRLYYSKVTDPTIWAAPDGGFFDVNPGDGDDINSICIQNDTIYIFKNKAIWSFQFTSDPASDGYLRVISEGKGCNIATVFNNEIYLVDEVSVYIFSNGQFVDIGKNLNFAAFGSTNFNNTQLCVWDEKLLVSIDELYAMNLNNGAWSKYQLDEYEFDGELQSINFSSVDRFSSCRVTYDTVIIDRGSNGIYVLGPPAGLSDVTSDKINVDGITRYVRPSRQFTTKEFTLNDEFNWKRLYRLKVQGHESPIGFTNYDDYQPQGFWRVADTSGSSTIRDSTSKDLNRITAKSVRFKILQLQWVSPVVQFETQTEDELVSPTFHKLQMIVGVKTEIVV